MSQGQKSPHEDTILLIIVIGLITVIALTIWRFFHAELTEALRWIRIGEMMLVEAMYSKDFTLAVPDIGTQRLGDWLDRLPNAPVEVIKGPQIKVITYLTMQPLRIVFAAGLMLMMLWAVLFGPNTKYRRKMNLEALIKEQAQSFPAIAPFIRFNPLHQPYRVVGQAVPSKLPLFSEALSIEEWIAFHEIKTQGSTVDPVATWKALTLQLGNRWRGPSKLPLHAQCLYAACALRHVRKRKESEELLNQLSLAWSHDKGFNLPSNIKSQVNKIIRDPKLGGELQKYADQHAFETTALLRCLSRARQEGGVLAPASFLWLRGQDRALWYPLNNLGRKAFHAEAAGALVHYTHELIAGQKIPTPRFEDVIKAIENMLKSPMARPIPPLDKTAGSKK